MHLPLTHIGVATLLVIVVSGCTGQAPATNGCRISTEPRLVELATAGDVSHERELGLKGVTTLAITVTPESEPYFTEINIVGSSGVKSLDRAAVYAAQYSRYAAGTCDGRRVTDNFLLKVSLP